jgi:hypothetical protein
MSVKNVPAVVNGKNYERTIYCTQVLFWVDGGYGEECGKEEECATGCCWPVRSQGLVRNVWLD